MSAQALLRWAGLLCLDGELALAEPKRVRQRLLHVAGRLVRSGRRVALRLPRSWPWAEGLVGAFARLRALPAAGSSIGAVASLPLTDSPLCHKAASACAECFAKAKQRGLVVSEKCHEAVSVNRLVAVTYLQRAIYTRPGESAGSGLGPPAAG